MSRPPKPDDSPPPVGDADLPGPPTAPGGLRLRVQPAVGEPFHRELRALPLTVGRSGDADLQVADRYLSRLHCSFSLTAGELRVEDLGSSNGTRVQGRRIEEPTVLRPGDVVELSATRITVEEAGAAASITGRGARSSTQFLKSASSLLPRDPGSDSAAVAPELRHYADRLKLMNEVHEALAGPLSLDELLTLILDRVFDHLEPRRAAILLRDGDGEYRLAAARGEGKAAGAPFHSRSLIEEVGEKCQAALVHDVAADERFATAESVIGLEVRSILAAPLLQGDRSLGLIVLSNQGEDPMFDEEDLALLVSLGSVAALRIRNLELREEALERRRLEAELTLARRIQRQLLPAELPKLDGYQLLGRSVPSRGVSGDYYTAVERTSTSGRPECVLMIADVSGKGIAAALLTASLEALTAGLIETGLAPEEICTRVSRRLHKRTAAEKFATAIVAVLDPEHRTLIFSNAGHNPGLLVRGAGAEETGAVETLASTGTPLGLVPDRLYQQGEASLAPGDTLLLYTDGYTEAEDPDGEEYGLDRLAEACRRHRNLPLAELHAALETDLEGFLRGAPCADDRTVLMLRVDGESGPPYSGGRG